jgi:hypothetical protein
MHMDFNFSIDASLKKPIYIFFFTVPVGDFRMKPSMGELLMWKTYHFRDEFCVSHDNIEGAFHVLKCTVT